MDAPLNRGLRKNDKLWTSESVVVMRSRPYESNNNCYTTKYIYTYIYIHIYIYTYIYTTIHIFCIILIAYCHVSGEFMIRGS
jgi:hypothetical protein